MITGESMMSQTEQANCAFYLQVRQIQGVEVEVIGGETWNEKTIVVTVADLFSATADEVIDLKTRLHQVYPSARLDVEIVETAAQRSRQLYCQPDERDYTRVRQTEIGKPGRGIHLRSMTAPEAFDWRTSVSGQSAFSCAKPVFGGKFPPPQTPQSSALLDIFAKPHDKFPS